MTYIGIRGWSQIFQYDMYQKRFSNDLIFTFSMLFGLGFQLTTERSNIIDSSQPELNHFRPARGEGKVAEDGAYSMRVHCIDEKSVVFG